MANSILTGTAWQSRSPWYRPVLSQGGVPGSLEGNWPSRQLKAHCDERFFTQTLDHFRHAPGEDEGTFEQRYFVCEEYWALAGGEPEGRTRDGDGGWWEGAGRGGERATAGSKGPIFFYTGNEADVSLYLEATGLMWENAPAFNALLVFAEHRFYGESLPFGAPDKGREFLSTSQALADYAGLITALRRDLNAEGSPVIAFGGSYGGMLSSWLRLKYPHIVHGAIAASAPVLALEGLRRPTPDPEVFAEAVTRAAGPAGGASEACADNVRRAFSAILSPSTARSSSSRSSANKRNDGFRDAKDAENTVVEEAADVARALRVCPGHEPQGEDALLELAWWARAAFDYLAMGNYPYATGYILNSGEGGVELPPWPLRMACSHLADPALQTGGANVLLSSLADAIGVYYNATGDFDCFSPEAGANNASSVDADNWNWQACTEMSMPMSTDGKRDMFWLAEWDPVAESSQCRAQFGVIPHHGWGATEYGGYASWSQVTNVVFSNGRLDPWSGLGVVDQEQAGPGVHVIMMNQAAHHLDLFFEHPLDPEDVREARRTEMDLVEEWVRGAYEADALAAGGGGGGGGRAAAAAAAGKIGEKRRSIPLWLEHAPALRADW